MGKVINVAILVDAANLIDHMKNNKLSPGSIDHPTSLGAYTDSDKFIYMVAKNAVVSNDQARSELTINAGSGDTIKWNMMTFGQNATYSAFVYSSKFNLLSGSGHVGIQRVGYENQVIGVRIPEGEDPKAKPGRFKNTIYTTSGDVTNIDQEIQYSMSFKLVDESSGDVLGYFSWDPFVMLPF